MSNLSVYLIKDKNRRSKYFSLKKSEILSYHLILSYLIQNFPKEEEELKRYLYEKETILVNTTDYTPIFTVKNSKYLSSFIDFKEKKTVLKTLFHNTFIEDINVFSSFSSAKEKEEMFESIKNNLIIKDEAFQEAFENLDILYFLLSKRDEIIYKSGLENSIDKSYYDGIVKKIYTQIMATIFITGVIQVDKGNLDKEYFIKNINKAVSNILPFYTKEEVSELKCYFFDSDKKDSWFDIFLEKDREIIDLLEEIDFFKTAVKKQKNIEKIYFSPLDLIHKKITQDEERTLIESLYNPLPKNTDYINLAELAANFLSSQEDLINLLKKHNKLTYSFIFDKVLSSPVQNTIEKIRNKEFFQKGIVSFPFYALLNDLYFLLEERNINKNSISANREKERFYEKFLKDKDLLKDFILFNYYIINRKDFLEKDYNRLEEESLIKILIDQHETLYSFLEGSSKKEAEKKFENFYSCSLFNNEKGINKALKNPQGFTILIRMCFSSFVIKYYERDIDVHIKETLKSFAKTFAKITKNKKTNIDRFKHSVLKAGFLTVLNYFRPDEVKRSVLLSCYNILDRISDKNFIFYKDKEPISKEEILDTEIMKNIFYYQFLNEFFSLSDSFFKLYDKNIRISKDKNSDIFNIIINEYLNPLIENLKKGFNQVTYNHLTSLMYFFEKYVSEISSFNLAFLSGFSNLEIKVEPGSKKNMTFSIKTDNKTIKEEFTFIKIKEGISPLRVSSAIQFPVGKGILEDIDRFAPFLVMFLRKNSFINKLLVKSRVSDKLNFKGNIIDFLFNYFPEEEKKEFFKESLHFLNRFQNLLTKDIEIKELSRRMLKKNANSPFIGPHKNYFEENSSLEEYIKKTENDNAYNLILNIKPLINKVKEIRKEMEKNKEKNISHS